MLDGFVEGGKYVVEEKLVGGRLLCHDLGIEGNKRIIPLGARVKNKLYTGDENGLISMYDGVKIQAYMNSILTCKVDDDGQYLEGIFFMYTDYSGFNEGSIYIFKGLDAKGNIIVEDTQPTSIKKIPKGVIISPDEYQQWVYDGKNTQMPPIGSDIWCTTIREDLIFVGAFSKKGENSQEKSDLAICPNCGMPYDPTLNAVKVKFSGVFKSGGKVEELCSRYMCPHCNSVIIKSDERLGSICISEVDDVQ